MREYAIREQVEGYYTVHDENMDTYFQKIEKN